MQTRIKELRARHNLTQGELADAVGVTRTTIAFLEKGKYNPSLKLAKMISLVLQEEMDEIFLWEERELSL